MLTPLLVGWCTLQVAQTFFVDPDLRLKLRLDAIITVVDAKFICQHLDDLKPEGVENEVWCTKQGALNIN